MPEALQRAAPEEDVPVEEDDEIGAVRLLLQVVPQLHDLREVTLVAPAADVPGPKGAATARGIRQDRESPAVLVHGHGQEPGKGQDVSTEGKTL